MLAENLAPGSERKSCSSQSQSTHARSIWIRARGSTYDVVTSDLVGLAPGAHDIGVVVGEDGNDVDTLLPQLGKVLDVARNVSGRADGSEGTCRGNPSDHDSPGVRRMDVWTYQEGRRGRPSCPSTPWRHSS